MCVDSYDGVFLRQRPAMAYLGIARAAVVQPASRDTEAGRTWLPSPASRAFGSQRSIVGGPMTDEEISGDGRPGEVDGSRRAFCGCPPSRVVGSQAISWTA